MITVAVENYTKIYKDVPVLSIKNDRNIGMLVSSGIFALLFVVVGSLGWLVGCSFVVASGLPHPLLVGGHGWLFQECVLCPSSSLGSLIWQRRVRLVFFFARRVCACCLRVGAWLVACALAGLRCSFVRLFVCLFACLSRATDRLDDCFDCFGCVGVLWSREHHRACLRLHEEDDALCFHCVEARRTVAMRRIQRADRLTLLQQSQQPQQRVLFDVHGLTGMCVCVLQNRGVGADV